MIRNINMPASLKHLLGPKENIKTILAKWKDGQYYKVDKIDCKPDSKQCLIKFEDDLEIWEDTTNLHLELAIDDIQDEDIVCCVCDDGTSAKLNEIIMCDGCQQGYHVNCHQPVINRDQIKLEDDLVEWFCNTCDYLIKQSSTRSEASAPILETPPKVKAVAHKAISNGKSKLVGKPKQDTKKRPSTPMTKSRVAKIKLGKRSLKDPETTTPDSNDSNPVITPLASQSTADMTESLMPHGQLNDDDEGNQLSPGDTIVAAFETVRIKKTQKKRSIDETPVSCNLNKQTLENGDKIEKMDSLVIEAAQALADNGENITDAKSFAQIIEGIVQPDKLQKSKPKLAAGSSKRKSKIQKSAAPVAAAF